MKVYQPISIVVQAFQKSPEHNSSYLATVVRIDSFEPHPNADRLQIAKVFGYQIITSKDAQPGFYCYFPLEVTIATEFLVHGNSFRDATKNADPLIKGYFDDAGRVKATNLRGQKSEGYIVPFQALADYCVSVLGQTLGTGDLKKEGVDFDLLFGQLFVQKYIPPFQVAAQRRGGKGSKKARTASILVDDQFRLHESTAQLKRNMHLLEPDHEIVITEKYHGTSFVVANVLRKRKLSWMDKLARWVGVNVVDTEYGLVYSSRSVVKNAYEDRDPGGFYKVDVWKGAADKIFPLLEKSMTAYGEIVGYTPTGNFIQKGYDYGCRRGECKYLIYRMTYTNTDGKVFELSHRQVVDYCTRRGLETPEVHYSGKIGDIYPQFRGNEHWHANILRYLEEAYLEKDCRYCISSTNIPAEGIVVRIEDPNRWNVLKLKAFRFLQKESADLDKGEVDIETSQVE